ncbi:MAG: vanadium-dependent haloperoxidase [Cyclobacteriaceae bacterium]|nr:vanadium-dependent haloperoxidase [Cyclobacteriaceae bacterium]
MNHRTLLRVVMPIAFLATFGACLDEHEGPSQRGPNTYSSDVVVKWLNLQLNMLRVPLAPGTGTQSADRAQAYCGIALYEALVQGMHNHNSLYGQLTDFPAMPEIQSHKRYHWAAVANAALADMNRKLFPTTSAQNKASMDSLENALRSAYALEVNDETLQRSIAFGKEVSSIVYEWAATDGSANVNPPYVPSGLPGTWVSTPPNFPAPLNPYASQRRLLTPQVADGTAMDPPPPYSAEPGSPFYAMVEDVYNKSLVLTPEQTAMAIYHRDVPGYPGGGAFVAALSQVISKAKCKLDVATIAYVKCGIAQHDAGVICFINKYSFNLVRPITYIRNEMGHPEWNALFNTPGHPEFPAAHAVVSSSVAGALTSVFGNNFKFTLHTYDYLGLPARNFNSFAELTKEMADSRVFGGIHYQASCDKGRILGSKVALNVMEQIEF